MALPIVLSLVDATLALIAVLAGWSALGSRPERPEATRVLAAAQRGARDLLTQAAPFGALFLVLFLASGPLTGKAPRDLALAGLFGVAIAAAGAWIAGWQVAQTTGRLSRAATAENVAIELGRLTTATLVLGGAIGGALSAVCFTWFPEAPVQTALTGVAASVGLSIVLLRPGILSWAAAGRAPATGELHPGSLAELVGGAFTFSGLLHTSLFALSALGQVALFELSKDARGGLGTYALLLPRVGLFALVCGGLGARSSERDPAQMLWLRELVVTLAVLAGGAWAASSVLAEGALRTWAPALVCYLCVAFGFAAWLLGSRGKKEPALAAWLVLLPVLLLVVLVQPEELGGTQTVLLLIVATSVALLPLAATYRLGASALASASTCERLATGVAEVGSSDNPARLGPSVGQRTLFLPIGLTVALGAASSVLEPRLGAATGGLLTLGFGALSSVLLLLALTRRQESLGDEGGARLAELTDQRPLDGGLLLGEGLAISRKVGGQEQLSFALCLVAPPLLLMGLAWGGFLHARDLAAGALVGALLWAAASEEPATRGRVHLAHTSLVWPLALYHLGWAALLVTSFP